MATFAELWEAEPVKAAPAQPTQSQRDQQRMVILQDEMAKAQQRLAKGDPRAQGDIDALTREMGGKVQPPAARSGATMADLWEATPAAAPKPEAAKPEEGKTEAGGTAVGRAVAKFFGQAQEAKRALGEIVATPVMGTIGAVAGPVAGLIESIQSGKYGTPEGVRIGEEKSAAVQRGFAPEIRTPQAQAVLGTVGKVMEATKVPPVGVPELMGFAPLAQPATEQVLQKGQQAAQQVQKAAGAVARPFKEAAAELQAPPVAQAVRPGMVSGGAAAVPDATTIKQALSVASPELQQAIGGIPTEKVNLPVLQRHIEADTLPVPVRLTEGQATGDVVKLSNEMNRRGKDPVLAQRFNEQNGQLVQNLEAFREKAAPDAPGSRTIDHSQGIIDAYKELDNTLNTGINEKHQALRDAAGGQFPVDAPKLLSNVEARLKKELLSNEAPAGQFKELQRLAGENNMTFEDYLSLRRNLGDVARTSADGQVRRAASLMIEELEKLPLQKEAAALKPFADQARSAARERFQMLEKDPAYRAAVNDSTPADKFLETFVVKGHNKNVQAMIEHLGQDSVARQHMAAGTINFLRDRAGIMDGQGNFTQAGYNKALKFLDDSNKMPLIFDGETATGLKTLGNVARYTQAQPRGAFVNNSNTLVGALAEKASGAVGAGVEKGLNVAVPGLQLGTSVMEMRARRAAAKETQKALELGAGTKQTGQNKLSDLGNK